MKLELATRVEASGDSIQLELLWSWRGLPYSILSSNLVQVELTLAVRIHAGFLIFEEDVASGVHEDDPCQTKSVQ